MVPYIEHYRSCQACPVHCKAEVRLTSGPHEGTYGDRPDFEPIVSWGVKAGIADPDEVIYLHHLCDIFGLDSVSAGNAVAFAFDLFEKGIIDTGDTGGLELRWGDAEAAATLMRQMAANQGLGALLGHGVRAAAEHIGRGAERYAYHVKGLELSAYDPRAAMGAGLAYAVSQRGGDYTSAYVRHEASMTPEEAQAFYGDARAADRTSTGGKAQMVKLGMTVGAVLDSLGMCKIPSLSLVDDYDLENEAELVTEVAGMPTSAAELLLVGERILTIEQLLNRRLGAGRADDDVPAMFHDEPLPDGPSAGATIDPAAMVAEFYGLMGWTEAGAPSAARLRELGLGEYVAEAGA
jgi:aldehyde:ferredoxin oxidoreductase